MNKKLKNNNSEPEIRETFDDNPCKDDMECQKRLIEAMGDCDWLGWNKLVCKHRYLNKFFLIVNIDYD